MSYKIIPTPRFKKETKRLIKKYASLGNELAALQESLEKEPSQGTSLGHGAYKIRLAVKSKKKGKSGGTRIVTYLLTEDEEVYLLTIYDKSEQDTVSEKTLKSMINEIKE